VPPTSPQTEIAPNPAYLRARAQSLHDSGKTAEAQALYVNLLARQRQELGDADPLLATTLCDFGDFLSSDVNDPSAAAEQYLQALPLRRAGPDADLAKTLGSLRDALFRAGRPKEAELYGREAVAMQRKLLDNEHQDLGHSLNSSQSYLGLGHSQWALARALAGAGRGEQAQAVMREALQTFEEAAHAFPAEPFPRQEVAFSHRLIGDLVEDTRQIDEAERQYRAAIAGYAALKSEVPGNTFFHQEEAYTRWMLAE
jgi:hypothetical protein